MARQTKTAKRTKSNNPTCPCCGAVVSALDLILDEVAGQISFGGASERFSPAEFRLFKAMLDAYPAIITKEKCFELLSAESATPPCHKIVDVKICQIRPRADSLGLVITTIWGVGYRLELAEPSDAERLRTERFYNTRQTRSSVQSGDIAAIKMLHRQGYTSTEIAARLRLTFKAVTKAFDILNKTTGNTSAHSKAA